MKRLVLLLLITLFTTGASYAQRNKEKSGDELFESRKYVEAIDAYQREIELQGLDLVQQLRLADSYYKAGLPGEAAKWYWKLHRLDTSSVNPLLKDYHLNYVMNSLKASEEYRDRSGTFLQDRISDFPKELMENADFNYNLLHSESNQELNYQLFSCTVNTDAMEFAPAFYGSKLLFSSDRPNFAKDEEGNYTGYLDIFVADTEASGQLQEARFFDELPTSLYHKATPHYAESLGSILYVTSNTVRGRLEFDDKGKNSLSIVSQRMGLDSWNYLMKDLSISFYYPFYDELSGRLYFAANLPGDTYGGTDIYYVYTNQGQIMSAPINLGPRINSPGNEIAPFIFEESLYFSSDIFYGLGGMDMYKANVQDADTFSIPVNLGPEINSDKDDYGLILKQKGEGLIGYFASNRRGGKGKDDIYGFVVDQKPGLKTLTLTGTVTKSYNSDVISDVLIELYNKEGELLKETLSDNSGVYRIEIPWEEEIRVRAVKDRFSFYERELGKERLEDLQDEAFTIRMSQYDDLVAERHGQKVIKLEKFYFGKGKTAISDDIARELDKVVEFAKLFPQVQIRIECHTDSRGSGTSNSRFTQERANKIKQYLVSKGVSSANLPFAIGFGEEKLVNNCQNGVYCLEVLHKQNQRTVFAIVNDNLMFAQKP